MSNFIGLIVYLFLVCKSTQENFYDNPKIERSHSCPSDLFKSSNLETTTIKNNYESFSDKKKEKPKFKRVQRFNSGLNKYFEQYLEDG